MSNLLDLSLDDIISQNKPKKPQRGGASGGSGRGGGNSGRGAPSRGASRGGSRGSHANNGGQRQQQRPVESARASAAPYKVPNKPRPDVNEAWVHDMFAGGRGGGGNKSGGLTRTISGAGASALPSTRIRVENLHWEVSEDDLRELFSSYGTIKRAKIHYDSSGRSEGSATVDFDHPDSVEAASAELDGVELDGLTMRITVIEQKGKPGGQEPRFTVNLGQGMRSDAGAGGGINARLGAKKGTSIQDRLGKKVPADNKQTARNGGGGGAIRTTTRGGGGSSGPARGGRGAGRGGRGGGPRKPLTSDDLDMELDSYMTGDQEITEVTATKSAPKFDRRQLVSYEEGEVPEGEAEAPHAVDEDTGMD